MTKAHAAIVRKKSGPFSIETIQLEEPRDDEVIVRIHGTGICHTDIVVRDQLLPTPLPAVLGHEGAGVVQRVGRTVTKVAAGDHIRPDRYPPDATTDSTGVAHDRSVDSG